MDKDLKSKLEQWDKNKPVNRQLEELQKIAENMGKLVKMLTYTSSKTEKGMGDVGSLLIDIRESLDDLVSKEDPESPDYAEPVVKALVKLEKSLTGAVNGLNIEPKVDVKAPDVKVNVPKPDFTAITKILKTDIPKAFDKAIKSIPQTEIPENDYTPLTKQLKELSEKLDSIDTGVRLKPQPGTIRISNLNEAADNTFTSKKAYSEVIQVVDSSNTYIGQAEPGSSTSDAVWRIKKIVVSGDTTTIYWAGGVGTFSKQWTARASYTYG